VLKKIHLFSQTVVLATAMVVVAACAGIPTPAPAQPAQPAEEDHGVVRFTFAPDPVWDYLTDNGIREEMEQECDVRILAAPTWDEFGIYAGGHADVVSVGSFEVPVVDEESGQDSTIFGKYNIERSIIVAPADSPAETLADLKGGKVAVYDTVATTMIWGILVKQLHDLDFRVGGGDFDLVMADITNTAELAASKDVDAAIILPDFSVQQLMSGRLKILYDGKISTEVYSDIVGASHEGPMINVFLGPTAWVESHPDEVACFLKIWERGIQEWQAHKDEIIATYPQHFAVETPEEIAFITDWLNKHDWFVSSVYLDEEWVKNESKLFDLMRDTGYMAEDQENPKFKIISP
jgi:ABC-type nitrate/sulfonate/bicarbonate transport system substrate-binding protein